MSFKVALVIGHHEKAKGAYSKWLKIREWDFYNEVVQFIDNADVFRHDPNISGYVSRIKDTAKRLDEGNYNLVIELHFNAFFDDSANGCETLYYFKNNVSKELSLRFSNMISDSTGIKIRGTGARALANKKDRGFASVYYPKADAILIEPFFGSNKDDCDRISNAGFLGCLIHDFIKDLKNVYE